MMRFEENEWIKDILERMDKLRKEESLSLLRELDNKINFELSKDILNVYERFGEGFFTAIAEKAGKMDRKNRYKKLEEAHKKGDIEDVIICHIEMDNYDGLSIGQKRIWDAICSLDDSNLNRMKKAYPKLVKFRKNQYSGGA